MSVLSERQLHWELCASLVDARRDHDLAAGSGPIFLAAVTGRQTGRLPQSARQFVGASQSISDNPVFRDFLAAARFLQVLAVKSTRKQLAAAILRRRAR